MTVEASIKNSTFEDSMELYLQQRTIGENHRTFSYLPFSSTCISLVLKVLLGMDMVVDKTLVVDLLQLEQKHSRKLKAFKVRVRVWVLSCV